MLYFTSKSILWGVIVDKHVFIINGSGGVGKDTVCEMAARFWKVHNISSITPIHAVARAAGWDGVKTPASRRLLSRLKEVCTEYNDLPFRYCVEQYEAFLKNDCEILFVHIREPAEIVRFRNAVRIPCAAILVRRPLLETSRGLLGNRSDDGVAAYDYDCIFENSGTLEELPDHVKRFFSARLA